MSHRQVFARHARLAIVPAICAAASSAACGQNLLLNPSFEQVGVAGPQTAQTGVGGLGHSAAFAFGVFNNIFGTTTTELVPSTLLGGGAMMLHVTTDNFINGIGQSFGVQGSGPACVISSVNVFVVSGAV